PVPEVRTLRPTIETFDQRLAIRVTPKRRATGLATAHARPDHAEVVVRAGGAPLIQHNRTDGAGAVHLAVKRSIDSADQGRVRGEPARCRHRDRVSARDPSPGMATATRRSE